MNSAYVIGIDLGTTNCVVAYAPLGAVDAPALQLLQLPQLVAAGTVESRTALPSFLYLAPPHEMEGLELPWASGRDFAVGELARRHSAEAPERTVAAAKSWLCYSKVDRHQEILPWQAPAEVGKISPVVATRRYLEHLHAAWDSAFPDAPLARQQIVLTVPASFDVSARELTREAALAAGFPDHLLLLEEPQAAVYAWLVDQKEAWRKRLAVGDQLLVCDVGGGTTDFTLVGVDQEGGELSLRRLAVGNHLLVGGDNMDLALAHHAAERFQELGTKLDPWQSVALWHSCRQAKEVLLESEGNTTHKLSILGRGSKLIGRAVSLELESQAIADLLLEGFFPACELEARPVRRRASGFLEIGLPFESDTAITRHLAAFLSDHGDHSAPCRPSRVLFNGGVFKSSTLRSRLLEVLSGWFPGKEAPQPLAGSDDLDHAVARGAAYYGWAKRHGGVRIRGGTSRSYYVGIETSGLAVPGAPRPLRALCVVPFGMEEGTEVDVPSSDIGLVLGEPATFRFFSSAIRKDDRPGDLLPGWDPEDIAETDSLESQLTAEEGAEGGYVPVRFHSKVTELGVFELWCVSTTGAGRWKLEFSVREEE